MAYFLRNLIQLNSIKHVITGTGGGVGGGVGSGSGSGSGGSFVLSRGLGQGGTIWVTDTVGESKLTENIYSKPFNNILNVRINVFLSFFLIIITINW